MTTQTTIFDTYPGSTPVQIVQRTIRKVNECMDRRMYSAARSYLQDTEETISILEFMVDDIESPTPKGDLT